MTKCSFQHDKTSLGIKQTSKRNAILYHGCMKYYSQKDIHVNQKSLELFALPQITQHNLRMLTAPLGSSFTTRAYTMWQKRRVWVFRALMKLRLSKPNVFPLTALKRWVFNELFRFTEQSCNSLVLSCAREHEGFHFRITRRSPPQCLVFSQASYLKCEGGGD